MLWLILIVLIIVALIAVINAANSSTKANQTVYALALQESLRRNHPDNILSQLGPNEFQRAYAQASFKRLQHLQRGMWIWFAVAFVAAGGVLVLLSPNWDLNMTAVWAAIIVLCGIYYVGRERIRRSAPEILDLMHQQQGQ